MWFCHRAMTIRPLTSVALSCAFRIVFIHDYSLVSMLSSVRQTATNILTVESHFYGKLEVAA